MFPSKPPSFGFLLLLLLNNTVVDDDVACRPSSAQSTAGDDFGTDNSGEAAAFVGRKAATSPTVAAKMLRHRTESFLILMFEQER